MAWLFLIICVQSGITEADAKSTAESVVITNEIKRLESLRLRDPKAFELGLDTMSRSINEMSSYQICHYKFLKAYQTAFNGNATKAVQDMESIIPLCEDTSSLIRLNALIANITAIGGDYKKASLHIDKAIQNADQTDDKNAIKIAYSGASVVYNLLDQRELSIKYSELLYELDNSSENLCRLEFSKNLNQNEGDFLIPEFSLVEKYSKQCKESGNLLLGQFLILDNLKRRLNRIDEDTLSVNDLQTIMEEIRPEISISPYKNNQATYAAIEAELAWLQGDYELAEKHGFKTLELNENLGHTDQVIMALKVLEKVAEKSHDYKRAYDFLQQRNVAELNIFDETQAKQMAFMTVKHSNLARVFELELLNQKNELLELEKKLSIQEGNNQKLLIGLILTLLALMILWAYKIKRRHDYFKGVSEIDHLTKVLTRKAFEDQMEVLLNHCQVNQAPIHVAIMDLDHFKLVNDNHGHLVGDWVLKNVIYACKPLVEESMIFARLGGEEFCIVMPDVDSEYMVSKLDEMRLAIENLDCSDSGAELSVTASFGVTSSEATGYSLPLLLTHADVALFKAKNQGRNQTVVYNNLLKPS